MLPGRDRRPGIRPRRPPDRLLEILRIEKVFPFSTRELIGLPRRLLGLRRMAETLRSGPGPRSACSACSTRARSSAWWCAGSPGAPFATNVRRAGAGGLRRRHRDRDGAGGGVHGDERPRSCRLDARSDGRVAPDAMHPRTPWRPPPSPCCSRRCASAAPTTRTAAFGSTRRSRPRCGSAPIGCWWSPCARTSGRRTRSPPTPATSRITPARPFCSARC